MIRLLVVHVDRIDLIDGLRVRLNVHIAAQEMIARSWQLVRIVVES